MANNWNTIYLGVTPIIDPTEGNNNAENAGSLVGRTFGGPNDKLFDEVTFMTTVNVGGSTTALDQNNSVANDQIRFDIGAGVQTTTFDAAAAYNVTITYTDGTTYAGSYVLIQDTLGNTFLVPETATGADQSALVAKPIQSVQLTSLATSNSSGLAINRQTTNFLACFTSGSHILTDRGEVQIDDLRAGDLVMTTDHGAQPIRWISQRSVSGQGSFAPILFRKEAVGNHRDLLVSPQHRMLVTGWRAELLFGTDEVLVPAKSLVNDRSILCQPCDTVTYFHMLFDRHEVVTAEGSLCESFYPGAATLSLSDEATLAELVALFPALLQSDAGYGATARMVVRTADATALVRPDRVA